MKDKQKCEKCGQEMIETQTWLICADCWYKIPRSKHISTPPQQVNEWERIIKNLIDELSKITHDIIKSSKENGSAGISLWTDWRLIINEIISTTKQQERAETLKDLISFIENRPLEEPTLTIGDTEGDEENGLVFDEKKIDILGAVRQGQLNPIKDFAHQNNIDLSSNNK